MTSAKVAVIGSGQVGETLANGFLKFGYKVMRASRETTKLADWQKRAEANASTGTFDEAAKWGDVVVLAVRGGAAESAIKMCGAKNLAGKTVLDATNPIADKPATNGVLSYFTTFDQSLMERLQLIAPDAHFVKCFSCVGHAHMVTPKFKGTKPTMFICGRDQKAKSQTGEILTQFGWEFEDMGGVEAARAIEPLCILWCLPGFTKNQWNHAFKLLKADA